MATAQDVCNATGGTTTCAVNVAYDITSMLEIDKKKNNKLLSYQFLAKQEIPVYSDRSMGRCTGDIILRMKPGTVYNISDIEMASKMVGNTTYADPDSRSWSAKIMIYPDGNGEAMTSVVNGYIALNQGTSDNFNFGAYMLLGEYNTLGLNVRNIDDFPENSLIKQLNAIPLITSDYKLNLSQVSDINELRDFNNKNANSAFGGGGYQLPTPIIKSYYATMPTSWKVGSGIQEVEDYNASLDSMDISKLRGVFGMPFQWLPTTDCRVDGSEDEHVFGTAYTEAIASRLPLLYLTPGTPTFLADSKSGRDTLISDVVQSIAGSNTDHLNNLLDGYAGKFYSIEPLYSEYFKYVNPMCRMGAIFLGLEPPADATDEERDYYKIDGYLPKNYNWAWNNNGDYNGDYSGNEDGGSNNTGFGSVAAGLRDLQKAIYYRNAIPFYINSDTQFTDNFTNETTESSLASSINGLSDKARELQYLIGTTTNVVAQQFDAAQNVLANSREAVENFVAKFTDSGNIFSGLFKNIKTVVSGGRLQFPNIWSNATFGRSYSVTINLATPNPDKMSWWLYIYVPLCHLIALVAPRGEFQNGYTAPFIVKAFYKTYNIDMGIITDMQITKGKDGGWTKDGLPTSVSVQFTIQDLYQSLSLTPAGPLFKSNVMQNIAELDYLANLCGININEPDTIRMVSMYVTLNIQDVFLDVPTNITTGMGNKISNKLSAIYQAFV